MTCVRFSDPAEFLDELQAEAARVEDKVVRVTLSWRRQVPTTLVVVLATTLVAGRIVKLERTVGDYLMSDGPEAKAVEEKANGIAEKIREGAKALGLECRAGVFTNE